MDGVDYQEHVRRLWAAFERDGIAGLKPLVDDDVEWTLFNGAGPVRGLSALADYWRSREPQQAVVPHTWEQHGECVLVHASMRVFRDGGFVDTQPSWVYFFRDGRLRRCIGFAGREEALAAIERHNAGD